MAEHGAPNNTGKQGHHERNKVAGEGPAQVSSTATTSGGAGELSTLDQDPDAREEGQAAPERGGPSMATRVADPGRRPPEESSYMPGGDKTSQPGVKEDDLIDKLGGGRGREAERDPGPVGILPSRHREGGPGMPERGSAKAHAGG